MMIRNIMKIVLVLLMTLVCVGAGHADDGAIGKKLELPHRSGELIVKYRNGRDSSMGQSGFHDRHALRSLKRFKGDDLEHVEVRPGVDLAAAMRDLENDPNVAYVEPNYLVHALNVPNDPSYSSLWGMTKISGPAAWNVTTGDQELVVAVIDTGIDYTHPDLVANLLPGYGYNAITGTYDPKDDHGHGTHVAGTIGAVGNNALGVTGVNWKVRIVSCKFLDSSGNGSISDAIECLTYIRELKNSGVNIVATNNSWGGDGYSQALYDAIAAQGDILFVTAAGNSGTNNDVKTTYPANYEHPLVISTAATASTDGLASFSDFGRRTVHVGAPGVSILSTTKGGGYGFMSGTSMASPHVAGLAALLKAGKPDLDWKGIRNTILASGDPVADLLGKSITGRRINAATALTCSNKTLFSALAFPQQPVANSTLSAISISCAEPLGPVSVTLSDGEEIQLLDNGELPDLVPGDGIFTGTYPYNRTTETFSFSSSAGSETFTIPLPPPLLIDATTLLNGMVGAAYSTTITATGGTAPYTWSLFAGSLPAGLGPITNYGVISGTPTGVETRNFSIKVTDSAKMTDVRTFTLAIKPPLAITTSSPLPNAWVGVSYSFDFAATGGTLPYRWNSTAAIPGLSAGLTGRITGKPTLAGTYTFTMTLIDGLGATIKNVPFSLTVFAGNQLPTVNLTAPVTGAMFAAPATINLAASASDADGTVSKVEFYNGATLLGTVTTSPYVYTWTNVPSGTYSVKAVAYDNLGASTTSAAATVTVAPGYTVTYSGNGSTGGSVPTDRNNYLQGATVTVLGNTGNLTRSGYTFSNWNTQADGSGASYSSGATFVIGSAHVTLYAQWTALPTYTVSYDGNGNTGGAVPIDGNNYLQGATVTVLGNIGNLSRSGYTFSGWNTQADGFGISYSAGATFVIGSAHVALYAQWSALPTYTVSYNGNGNTGGAVPIDSNNYFQGAAVTVLDNTGNLTRTGYVFTGWNSLTDGSGVPYSSGATFVIGSADVILYAQWSALPTYTVSYDGNGNTGGAVPTDSSNYLQGAMVTVLGNTGNLTMSGYTFSGWNTLADGSGSSYIAGATFAMGSANVTLYAQWTALPTYTVSYDGNGNTGGVVPTDSNNYLQGATVTVPGNIGNLTMSGYTFSGWNTLADGSGSSYIAGATFAMGSANVTLYAQWTALPTYTVSYDGNGNTGGAVPTDSNNYLQGATVTVLGNTGTLTKSGYTFSGWNTQADGSGSSYAAGSTFTIGAVNIILYAQWQIISGRTNVALAANGGKATCSSAGASYQPGEVIDGFRTGANGYWRDTTFNAWPDWIQVTFNGQKTIAEIDVITAQDNLASTVEPIAGVTTFTMNGITVYDVQYWNGTGWATLQHIDNKDHLVWQTITFPAVTTNQIRVLVTAALNNNSRIVEIEAYTGGVVAGNQVIYHGNSNTGGTVPVDTGAYIQGATVTVSGNTGNLTRTGYLFSGWNSAADGSGAGYVAGDTFVMGTANVTLYAQWTVLPTYTVLYDGNGNTGGAAPLDTNSPYLQGTTVTVLGNTGNLTRTGYTFSGWNTAANGSGTSYAPGVSFTIGSSVTLYAQWTNQPTYSVMYDGNGNTGGASPLDVNSPYLQGATVTVLGNTGNLTRTGYTFAGWNTAVNGSGTSYAPGTTFSIGSSVTLYAQWSLVSTRTNVALQANGGTATASSFSTIYPATAVNNGDRRGLNYGAGGVWRDGTYNTWPDWVQITFNGQKTISEVNLFTLQDTPAAPLEPTAVMTFSKYGITAFDIQYCPVNVTCSASAGWVTVPGGRITGNSLVWNVITFPAVTTDRIRVVINGAKTTNSFVTEIEAY